MPDTKDDIEASRTITCPPPRSTNYHPVHLCSAHLHNDTNEESVAPSQYIPLYVTILTIMKGWESTRTNRFNSLRVGLVIIPPQNRAEASDNYTKGSVSRVIKYNITSFFNVHKICSDLLLLNASQQQPSSHNQFVRHGTMWVYSMYLCFVSFYGFYW